MQPSSQRIYLGRGILKIRIHDGGLAVDARMRAQLQRRLDFALSSMGDRIAQITVRLSRDAARRTQPLDRCDIEVTLRPRSVRVADTGKGAMKAIENAAERLGRSVNRALERESGWAAAAPEPLAAPVVAGRRGR